MAEGDVPSESYPRVRSYTTRTQPYTMADMPEEPPTLGQNVWRYGRDVMLGVACIPLLIIFAVTYLPFYGLWLLGKSFREEVIEG